MKLCVEGVIDQFHDVGLFVLRSDSITPVFKQGVAVTGVKSATGVPILSSISIASMAKSLW